MSKKAYVLSDATKGKGGAVAAELSGQSQENIILLKPLLGTGSL